MTKKQKAEVPAKCGHSNRHSYGVDGKPDGLSCSRREGHAGNHGADHLERLSAEKISIPDMATNPKEIVYDHREVSNFPYRTGSTMLKIMGYEGKFWREWTDMAGVKPSEVEQGPKPALERAGKSNYLKYEPSKDNNC